MVDQDAARLRHRLAQQIADEGNVRSPQWRDAVESVPRHEFVPEFFNRVDAEAGPTLWAPRHTLGVHDRIRSTPSDPAYRVG
jgi:protein-L-isoaspartate O-methyltransferase